VARAKRTDRTEARRRHRAEQAALATTEPGDGTDATPAADRKAPDPKAAPAARPSIMASFRAAIRPLDLRGDLRAIPQVLTNWGFLAAIGLSAALGVWFVITYNDAMAAIPVGTATPDQLEAVVAQNQLPYIAWSMALQPPPMVGAFLIGFAAKRASWLGGLVYGIFIVAMAAITVQTSAGRLLSGDTSPEAVIVAHAAWTPIGAALFASAAAWYRRFLDLANPNRVAQRQARQQQQGRGDMKPARR
jgi:hypothetical protein